MLKLVSWADDVAKGSPVGVKGKKEAQQRQEDLMVRVRADVVHICDDLQAYIPFDHLLRSCHHGSGNYIAFIGASGKHYEAIA